MKLKQFVSDDSAVSPVIGVILMVAITVILAAVIGTFVLGLGDSLQQTAPSASFDYDFHDDGNVTITHSGGSTIGEGETLRATVSGGTLNNTGEPDGDSFDLPMSAGSSDTFELENGEDWDGQTVRVVWESEDGSSSSTLSTRRAPAS
jgi:flagellin-like protein